jgi:hypothetical protein
MEKKEVFFEYENYAADQTFPVREERAAVTTESSAELLKNGYVPIGTVEVRHDPAKRYDLDPTTQAMIIAAKRGGDLVTLDVNNETREIVEYKRGKCLESKKQQVYAWQPYGAYDRWQEVQECLRWEQVPVPTMVLMTKGKVWRHDPEFVKMWADRMLFGAIENSNTSFAKTLLDNTAVHVNATDKFGWTALMYAAHYGGRGNYEIADRLIKMGADVNATDQDWKTALMRAAFSGNIDIAKLLISHGADASARDRSGKTALDLASSDILPELKRLIEQSKKVK